MNNPTVRENHNNSNNNYINPHLNNDIIDAAHFKYSEIAEHISNRDGIPFLDLDVELGSFRFDIGPKGSLDYCRTPASTIWHYTEVLVLLKCFDPTPSCPAPRCSLKYRESGEHKPAGELVVGDKVYTAHEETGEYGLYDVEYVKVKQEQRLKVTFEDGFEFIGSKTHKFKVGDNWIETSQLNVGNSVQGNKIVNIEKDIIGDVVVITVTDAHTYVVGELLPYNKPHHNCIPEEVEYYLYSLQVICLYQKSLSQWSRG